MQRTVIIKGDPHVNRCPAQRLGGGNEVGTGTYDILEIRICLLHDHGIHSEAGDNREVFTRHAVDSQLDQIDIPGVLAECHRERLSLGERDIEVPG
jgi:hypothetical protein